MEWLNLQSNVAISFLGPFGKCFSIEQKSMIPTISGRFASFFAGLLIEFIFDFPYFCTTGTRFGSTKTCTKQRAEGSEEHSGEKTRGEGG